MKSYRILSLVASNRFAFFVAGLSLIAFGLLIKGTTPLGYALATIGMITVFLSLALRRKTIADQRPSANDSSGNGDRERLSWSYMRRYRFVARTHLSDIGWSMDCSMSFYQIPALFLFSLTLSIVIALPIILIVGMLAGYEPIGGLGFALIRPLATSIFVTTLPLGPFAMLAIFERLERCRECRKLGQKTPTNTGPLCSFHDWEINEREKTWPSYRLGRKFVSVPEGEEAPITLLLS